MIVKKKRLKKPIRVGLSVLVGMLFVLFFFMKSEDLFLNKNNLDQDLSSYITKNTIDKKEDSIIKLSYPQFGFEDFDETIANAVKLKEQEFLEEVRKTKEIQPDLLGELIVDYDVFVSESLLSVHLSFQKYLGGANYDQEDLSFYYDIKSKKEIRWEDLFVNQDTVLDRLSTLSQNQLKSLGIDLWDEELLNDGISCKKENFEHLYLDESGMQLLFPIYQVGPRSSGNIWINFKYAEVNELLKEDFRGVVSDIQDEMKQEISDRDLRDVTKFQDKKLVALTFDDGPSYSITEELLNGLKERDAKVTFFVLGSRAEQYQSIVQRAYHEGHTICSHSYDHKNLLNLEEESLLEDLNKTNEAIFQAIGTYPFALRPPYGNVSQEIIDAAGMPIVLWNVDPEDWANRDAEITYQNILKNIEDGSIILLHDLYGTSVEAALKLIDDLSKEGYVFVSLEELQRMDRISTDSEVISNFKQ